MRATVDRKALADALEEVRKVARKKRGPPEALRCALVRAADNRLWIEATDLDQAIRVPVPAMVFEDGGALVPADLAAEVVGRMPKQAEDGDPAMASLSVLGTVGGATRLRIEVGRVSAIVEGTGPEDYPAIPWAGGDAPRAEADAAALGEAVSAAAIAAAAGDCGRSILCGVCVETDAGAIRAVATDGRRLHCIECPAERAPAEACRAVLPLKAAKWLAKRLAGADGKAVAAFPADAVEVLFADGSMYRTKTLAGVYPEWRKVVPDTDGACATVARDALAAAAALSSAFAAESLRRGVEPAMEIAPENGALSASTKTPDGEISERVDAAGADAWPGTHLNPLYLADALRAAGTGEVELRRGSGVVLVRSVGAPRFEVLMPLQV